MQKTFTDVFDEDLTRAYCAQLSVMVGITQTAGLTLIFLGLKALENIPDFHARLRFWTFFVGMGFFIVWAVYCWRDYFVNAITNSFEMGERVEWLTEARRKTAVLRATLVLIVVDTLMLITLISLTGGPGESPLDPLLPIIPIIAMILRQPRRTALFSLTSGLLFGLAFMVHWGMEIFSLPHSYLHLPEGYVYEAHGDPGFPFAYGIVATGAIVLSAAEYLITQRRAYVGGDIRTVFRSVVNSHPEFKGIQRHIRRGAKTWIKWLDHRDLYLRDLSLVHQPDEVIRQAIILSAPFWIDAGATFKEKRNRNRIVRRITFLTFAAHWIDDHFDALAFYCRNPSLREEILASTPESLLNEHFTRLEELVKRMKRAVDSNNTPQVDRAVTRIIYGGLIQNAREEERFQALLKNYVDFVCEGLSPDLSKIYQTLLSSSRPMIVWTTAKVVLELLDASSNEFKSNQSEFFDLWYAPILFYQDSDSEIAHENFGAALRSHENENGFPQETDFLNLIESCELVEKTIFDQNQWSQGRLMQLTVLLEAYGSNLPDALNQKYQSRIQDRIVD